MMGQSKRLGVWMIGILLAVEGCSDDSSKEPGVSTTGGTGAVGFPGAGTLGSAGTLAAGGSGIGVGSAGMGVAGRGVGTGGAGMLPGAAGRGPLPPPPTGSGAPPVGTGGAGAGGAGMTAGGTGVAGNDMPGGAAGSGPMPMPSAEGGCTPGLPPTTDYGERGPMEVMTVDNTGPGGQYTMFRPRTLGESGFKHPPVTWGNGVTTVPSFYVELLSTVASHGFVVIASNSSAIAAQQVRMGLEWLIEQNGSGEFAGKLAVDCAGAIGYSMGGGAAVGAAAHPKVMATVSLHGLTGAAGALHGPLLLITSTNDGFVTKAQFVVPTYSASTKVPTIMATLNVPGATPDFVGHLIPLGDAGDERAPLVAWLRLFLYGDQGARDWFYGPDCTLCKTPWTDIQRKNHMW